MDQYHKTSHIEQIKNPSEMIKQTTTAIILLIATLSLQSQVRMPALFSDNMVLQRNKEIVVWGWAAPKERVELSFRNQKIKATASQSGEWRIILQPSSHGGPYAMKIKGSHNEVTFNNILIGDVWLSSGQSNMEWPVDQSNNAKEEKMKANCSDIRLFTVARSMDNVEKNDVSGTWQECTSETIGSFSAVAYFFGREIHHEVGVPIGLINSSWGGTVIETWTDSKTMGTLPQYRQQMEESSKGDFTAILNKNEQRRKAFVKALKNDPGIGEEWQNNTSKLTNKMRVPGNWDSTPLSNMDGSVWFIHDFELTGISNQTATLSLGAIDDRDITWINGVEVGRTNSYSEKRVYQIPAGVLRNGKNTIVVNVVDDTQGGGIYSEEELLYIEVDSKKHALAGTWNYAVSVDSRDYGTVDLGPNTYPSLLFNAMIAPLVQFPIKGVIWYQGESNTGNPQLYKTLFPNMIVNWRERWGDNFPFYWVNLANYMAADKTPSESEWAELREAQTATLRLPATGQALAIDIGDANDIHPRNKQEVGRRLALLALKNDYGKETISSGPVATSWQTKENQIIVTFKTDGSALTTSDKYGYIRGFAIAGHDKKFVWAQAFIDGNKVVVWSPSIENPAFVRYGWGNNPDDANLTNSVGLPATPFRSDQ